MAWKGDIGKLREYLTVLRSILDTGAVDFHGEQLTAAPHWPVRVAGGGGFGVYVAAMGPKALQATGELADGTLLYLAGPRTIAEFIVPTIGRAAAEAGRPAPRVVAVVPVLLTDDVAAGRELAARELAFYEPIPSYRKVIARERVDGIADLAAVGSPDEVIAELRRYRDAGATDIAVSPLVRSGEGVGALWRVTAAI